MKIVLALSSDRPNRFGPSRSLVTSAHGMVATSQPLAALAGVEILQRGGNAVDAAITAAAMLNVTEPMSTGIGGDAFALIYEAKPSRLLALNGSGRSAHHATLAEYQRRLAQCGDRGIPLESILAVTVPGTVDAWAAAIRNCGRMPLAEVLAPAIQTAEAGFPVAPQTSLVWMAGREFLLRCPESAQTWLYPDTHAPQTGEMFKNPRLARTLRMIAEGGRDAFYRGAIAEAIARFSDRHGGLLTKDDLADHTSSWVEPITVKYRGFDIFELPPNGQGIAALEALNILAHENLRKMGHNTADTVHLQLEAMKVALHDCKRYVTDPESSDIPVSELLSAEYAQRQRDRISMEKVVGSPGPASSAGGDTVYICAADTDGNVVSLINSIFTPWASGLTVEDTGILLQNRGNCFSFDPDHVNVIAPHKRTRHTIIPAMLFEQGRPVIAFGFVGGDMQPQAQLQFVCNLVDFDMSIQDALDAPRWQYNGTGLSIGLEEAMPSQTRADLNVRGHEVAGSVGFFGGGQAILIHPEYGTLQGGSDSRRDGCAIGY